MSQADVLFEAFEEARMRAPHLGCRKLAQLLDTSEGEIQAARLGRGVRSLSLTPCDLVMLLPRLGRIKMLTQTPHASMTSHIEQCQTDGDQRHARLLDNNTLVMKLLLPCWYWVCLSQEQPDPHTPPVPCLQVFDRFGHVLHKLYALEPDQRGWQILEFYAALKVPGFTRCIEAMTSTSTTAYSTLLNEWPAMSTTEDFSRLLGRHRLRRVEANRAVAGYFSEPIETGRFIMVMAGACRQVQPTRVSLIHRGGAHHHRDHFEHFRQGRDPLVHLESAALSLCIDSSALHEAWRVSRPGPRGWSTSVEAFDARGQLMAALDTTEIEKA